jgi:lipid-binding SYLF domain-containing protein
MHTVKSANRARDLALASAAILALATCNVVAHADESTAQLDDAASTALHLLYRTNPAAKDLSRSAKEILVFPKIIKAGLVFGGAYGEGVLYKGGTIDGYYNSVSASWGWQAGVQSYGYVVFLMNDKAVHYVHSSHGWEVGVGPTIAVVDKGAAANLSSTTLRKDAYAFIFDQKGLMASLSIEGTKISRIKP